MPAIGKLKHRLELLDLQRTSDGAGGNTRSDTVAGTVWAEIKMAGFRESQMADRAQQRVSHVATVRRNPEISIKQGMRARWQEYFGQIREFHIESVEDTDLDGRFLTLNLSEGGPL